MIFPIWAFSSIAAWARGRDRQVEGRRDRGPDPGAEQGQDVAPQILGHGGLAVKRQRAQERPGDADPFGHDVAQGDRQVRPAAAREMRDLPVGRHHPDVLRQMRPGGDVEQAGDALTPGRRHHLVGQIRVAIRKRLMRAEILGRGDLLRAPGGGDDAVAQGRHRLKRDMADAAGAAVEQGKAVLGEGHEVEEVPPGGEGGLGKPRRLDVREAVGRGQDEGGVGHHILAIAAALHQRHDTVADPGTDPGGIDARADGGNRAADLQPRHGGAVAVPPAGSLVHVMAVDAGGADPDQHLAIPRLRHREGLRLQHLGAAGGGNDDCGLGVGQGHGPGHPSETCAETAESDSDTDCARALRRSRCEPGHADLQATCPSGRISTAPPADTP